MAFIVAENEDWLLEDLPQADFGYVPERFLLSARTKSMTENFVNWKLRPLFVFVVFQCIFSSWALVPMHFKIFIWGLSILLFSLIKKSWLFLSVMGLFCLYDKQSNTWLLVDTKFLFLCSNWHLARLLHSFLSYQVKHA